MGGKFGRLVERSRKWLDMVVQHCIHETTIYNSLNHGASIKTGVEGEIVFLKRIRIKKFGGREGIGFLTLDI